MRTWLAFAALGAGMIHLALVISSPLPLAIALGLLGSAEFGWGVLTFASDRLVAPRIVRAVAVAPIIVWSLLVVTATLLDTPDIAAPLTLLPMSTATAFGVFVAAVLSRHLRRLDPNGASSASQPASVAAETTRQQDAATDGGPGSGQPRPALAPDQPSAARYLVALMAGALVVSLFTTPALASTEAGRYAQPHGDHDADFVPAPVDEDPLDGLILPEHHSR